MDSHLTVAAVFGENPSKVVQCLSKTVCVVHTPVVEASSLDIYRDSIVEFLVKEKSVVKDMSREIDGRQTTNKARRDHGYAEKA